MLCHSLSLDLRWRTLHPICGAALNMYMSTTPTVSGPLYVFHLTCNLDQILIQVHKSNNSNHNQSFKTLMTSLGRYSNVTMQHFSCIEYLNELSDIRRDSGTKCGQS